MQISNKKIVDVKINYYYYYNKSNVIVLLFLQLDYRVRQLKCQVITIVHMEELQVLVLRCTIPVLPLPRLQPQYPPQQLIKWSLQCKML